MDELVGFLFLVFFVVSWFGFFVVVFWWFFDVLSIERGLPKCQLSAYRADLYAFDRWLIEAKSNTLISATKQDVDEYLKSSTTSIEDFYGFLVDSGCRDDNPTKAPRKPRKRRL